MLEGSKAFMKTVLAEAGIRIHEGYDPARLEREEIPVIDMAPFL